MQLLKDLVIALSLANLCFFAVWADILPGSPSHYVMKAPPSSITFFAVILNVLLLAAMFWVALALVRRLTRAHALNLARWAFLVVLIVPLNGMRQQFLSLSLDSVLALIGKSGFLILGLILALLLVFVLLRWHRSVIRAAETIVLVLFPFVLVTFGQAVWSSIKVYYDVPFADYVDKPLAPLLTGRKISAPRVLWLLFDGMDQRITFLERPRTVKLLEIDRLSSQALTANNAYPPASLTLLSMPSLITGRLISNAQPVGPNELMITFRDATEAVGWGTQPNVFSKARELGFNTAVVGWWHPYCRVIGDSLADCSWQGDVWDHMGRVDLEMTLSESILNLIPILLNTIPLTYRFQLPQRLGKALPIRLPERNREEHIKNYLSILKHAKEVVTNPDLGLILVHWPIPHSPYIYNRFKDDFTLDGDSSYFDNLALVDFTLGEIRSAMESADIWEKTSVLMTSDHWYRARKIDHRVPFVLKVADQKEPVAYDPAFNTVLIHDLVFALLRGEVSGVDSVVSWLDQHRSKVESPEDSNNL